MPYWPLLVAGNLQVLSATRQATPAGMGGMGGMGAAPMLIVLSTGCKPGVVKRRRRHRHRLLRSYVPLLRLDLKWPEAHLTTSNASLPLAMQQT